MQLASLAIIRHIGRVLDCNAADYRVVECRCEMTNKPWYVRYGVMVLLLAIFGAGLAIPEIRLAAFLMDFIIIVKQEGE